MSSDEHVVEKVMLADDKIVGYRFKSLGAEAAEIWFADAKKLYDEWEDEKPLNVLLDLSAVSTNLLSSDAMQRGHQVSEINRAGKTAFVIDHEKPATKFLIQFLERGLDNLRERAIFESEPEAIAWLLA